MKTPKILIPALRQYQHNDCSGLIKGFDYDKTVKAVQILNKKIDALQPLGLTRMLAVATTAHNDFTLDHQNIIVIIGKGMFWSKEFDTAARDLAKKIDNEFEQLADIGS